MPSPDHPTHVIGAAPVPGNRTWFTISGGEISTVCYPRIDQPILDSLRFVVAAPPKGDDESEHDVRWLEPGIPSFIIESRLAACSLTLQVIPDPGADALVISGVFRPDQPDVRLRLRAESHGPVASQVLDREPPALAACIRESWLAMIGPFDSCGVGAALTAELGVKSGAFAVALGFGDSIEAAENAAHAALATGASALSAGFAGAWRALPGPRHRMIRAAAGDGSSVHHAIAQLRCLEDKERPGVFASAPGAAVSARDGVWIASALFDAGDPGPAQRVLTHLAEDAGQEGGDPVDVALPVLLTWRLHSAGALDHDPWPRLIRRAATWLVAQPPQSQAETVAALLAAADLAGDAQEPAAAEHLRVVADDWQAGVESWELTPGDGSLAAHHAEHLRELAARARSRPPDLLHAARERYRVGQPAQPIVVWHEGHRPIELAHGRVLRAQLRRRGTVAWTADGWATSRVVEAHNTGLGCWVADMATNQVRAGVMVEWTATYADGRWEPSLHKLAVIRAAS